MRLIEQLRHDHEVCVACPAGGPLADALARADVRHLPLPEVALSMRLHPLQTPLGLGQLAAACFAVTRAVRRFGPDVVHANSLRAGLMAALKLLPGSPPVVVRTHDRLPRTPLARGVRAIIVRSAAAVVAVSDYTARRFNEGLDRPVATRVYNGIDHERLRSRSREAGAPARAARRCPGRSAARPGGPDHALEGPGPGGPGSRADAQRRPRRPPAPGGRGGVRRARPCATTTARSCARWGVSSTSSASGRQCTSSVSARTWPRCFAPSISRCCLRGMSRSAWLPWRAWLWALLRW